MAKSKRLNTYYIYFLIFNTSIATSFFSSYSDIKIFIDNFDSMNLEIYQLLLIINFITTFFYFFITYVFDLVDKFTIYTTVYLLTYAFLIFVMWSIKFINLSRQFLLINFLVFTILIFLMARFQNTESDERYITFDKSLSLTNDKFIFSNYEKFPIDFFETVSKEISSRNLTGLIHDKEIFNRLGFEKIIEVSNFLGVNIYSMEDSKLTIIHKTSNLNNILKNFLDIFILLLFSPIFIALLIFFSLLVFIIDGAPIFYSQTRVGLNGRLFKIFKFRTMKNLQLTKEELDELNERDKIVFKSKNDPRVTRLGTFLRRSSVDELPQLINIFKNDMSFIGPRPPIPSEVLKYEPKHLKRVSVKPGITGLWQVTLRQDNDFDRWVEKDIEYIEDWSLILDLKIIFKTFREIFKLTGD